MSKLLMAKSPVEIARESLGLNRREGAMAAGVTYHSLYEIETGLVCGIAEPIRKLFGEAGFDVEALEERQRAWREEQGADLRTRLAALRLA
jgi:hypothetical protein